MFDRRTGMPDRACIFENWSDNSSVTRSSAIAERPRVHINMVTLANLGSVRLPSLKFVGLRVRKIRRILCVSCYNSFPVIRTTTAKKLVSFTYPGLHFCLPWGRPCGNHAKRPMNEKTIQCLPNPSQHVPIYLQQFPSYSNRKCK